MTGHAGISVQPAASSRIALDVTALRGRFTRLHFMW
jgi:hypothetical protein